MPVSVDLQNFLVWFCVYLPDLITIIQITRYLQKIKLIKAFFFSNYCLTLRNKTMFLAISIS